MGAQAANGMHGQQGQPCPQTWRALELHVQHTSMFPTGRRCVQASRCGITPAPQAMAACQHEGQSVYSCIAGTDRLNPCSSAAANRKAAYPTASTSVSAKMGALRSTCSQATTCNHSNDLTVCGRDCADLRIPRGGDVGDGHPRVTNDILSADMCWAPLRFGQQAHGVDTCIPENCGAPDIGKGHATCQPWERQPVPNAHSSRCSNCATRRQTLASYAWPNAWPNPQLKCSPTTPSRSSLVLTGRSTAQEQRNKGATAPPHASAGVCTCCTLQG